MCKAKRLINCIKLHWLFFLVCLISFALELCCGLLHGDYTFICFNVFYITGMQFS